MKHPNESNLIRGDCGEMGEVKLTFLGAFQRMFGLEGGGLPVGGACGGDEGGGDGGGELVDVTVFSVSDPLPGHLQGDL
jgi:hypothetical protein